jgi:2-polyprenyl-6-methoxyphenol hydroxylase-like FAD-dependent oxidoreductase
VDDRADVVVVGGSLAGATLATVLARAGVGVTVLERETQFRDRVRGESIAPWGGAEAQKLGLEQLLLDAGGSYASMVIPYDEVLTYDESMRLATPVGKLVPGVGGWLDVGHPQMCEAVLGEAVATGANVVRGVTDVTLTPGSQPEVTYVLDGVQHTRTPRLVVGADGRNSSIRRALGIELQETPVKCMGGGMLVADVEGWPIEEWAVGTVGDVYYIVVPRIGGLARLYLLHDVAQKGRFSGPDRQAELLAAFRLPCVPNSDVIADGTPAGPCSFHPMNDAWCDRPLAEGAVLIGDAAGWNDPINGQGLAVALRDARMVGEVIASGADLVPAAFEDYAVERRERMRRLRAAALVATEIRATFSPASVQRRRVFFEKAAVDSSLLMPWAATIMGPEAIPADFFTDENIESILALG